MSLAWSAQLSLIWLPLYIYSLLSSSGIVQSKNVSDKQMMPMLLTLINVSIKGALRKSLGVLLLIFQGQK